MGNCVWNYFEKPRDFVQVPEILPKPTLGGGKYAVKYVRDTKEYLYISVKKGKQDIAKKIEMDYVKFVGGLQQKVQKYVPSMVIRTEYKRFGHLFWSDTLFRGRIWRDWVLTKWADEKTLPCHIWGFVNLTSLPKDIAINYKSNTCLLYTSPSPRDA